MAPTGKRRGSETSRSASDSKKRKAPLFGKPIRASSIDRAGKARPPPLKSSFKKGLHSPRRISPPVTFNKAVNYDDGSLTDISQSPITPPPPYVDEDVIVVDGRDHTAGPGAAASEIGTGNSKSANSTKPVQPGVLKQNPWFLPRLPTTTTTTTAAAPETETRKQSPRKKTPKQKAPETVTPGKKITVDDTSLASGLLSSPVTPSSPKTRNESGRVVIEALVLEPRALGLEEISNALIFIRDEVRDFGTTHFSHELTAREKHDWPLAALQDRNPEFVANCAYIADGSQYGWRKLFTESYCRPQFVTGLVAHYLVEHVFKHTCFGLSQTELAYLEDEVLKKYIHWDGFVRSKQLAAEIGKILKSKSTVRRAYDKHVAVTTLSSRIFSTISRLLPYTKEARTAAAASLQQVIRHAQALAISIRLTGANRTVVRFEFPAKHSEFQLDGSQNCLNAARVDATAHHAPDTDRDELRVKIPCWPTIIATVPTGPDMLDFADDPTLLERAGQPIPESAGAPPDNPGAYVTEVFLSPADVYCEWTPLTTPLEYPYALTLRQAIQQAKKERALRLGQPWPPTTKASPLKRTARVVLGAAAVTTLATTAIAATTPRGRGVLLHAARDAGAYLRAAKTTVTEQVGRVFDEDVVLLKQAAEGLAPKASFFKSVLGSVSWPTLTPFRPGPRPQEYSYEQGPAQSEQAFGPGVPIGTTSAPGVDHNVFNFWGSRGVVNNVVTYRGSAS